MTCILQNYGYSLECWQSCFCFLACFVIELLGHMDMGIVALQPNPGNLQFKFLFFRIFVYHIYSLNGSISTKDKKGDNLQHTSWQPPRKESSDSFDFPNLVFAN